MSAAVPGWVRAHPILAGALACALVGTAHAEYTLATATAVNPWVALAVPGALDLYVIQALRVHRDVAAAVLVMVAANVVSHLIAGGLYPAGTWWRVGVTAAVGALAPGIVWRVHSLERARTRTEILWGAPAGTQTDSPEYKREYAPAPGEEPPAHLRVHLAECTGTHPGSELCSALAAEYAPAPVLNPDAVKASGGYSALASVPDSVPEWMHEEYPAGAEEKLATVLHLPFLPDLPAEYECAPEAGVPGFDPASALHSDVLRDGDWAHLADATEYVGSTPDPSVRGMKDALSIGQERAIRLMKHLGVYPR